MMALEVDQRALAELTGSPDVASVRIDELRRPSLSISVPLIGGPTAWALGATGAGWTVAVLDSGVDKAHPFLAGKVVAEACYSTTLPVDSATSVCPGGVDSTAVNSGLPCPPSVVGCSHGTHMAGVATGNGATFSGVAKDASIIAIQVYSSINNAAFCAPDVAPCAAAYDSDVLAGLDRVYVLRTQFNIASVSLALGSGAFGGSCDGTFPAYKAAIDLLRGVGIATVVSAGNEGLTNAVNAPACVSSAISVGATNNADALESYSNRNASLNLLAPGTSINSSNPGGGFSTFTGTSMSAAHVAGAWALVKDLNPGASVTGVLGALTSTGVPIVDPANGTFFRINVGAAVQTAPQTPATLRTAAKADFNGDFKADLVWRNNVGALSLWTMNGLAPTATVLFQPGSVDPVWKVAGSGDLDGDGKPEIIWQHMDGWLSAWWVNGPILQASVFLNPNQISPAWKIVAVADMNGDAKADLIWRHDQGWLSVWYMNGPNLTSSTLLTPNQVADSSWTVVGAGDLNGDAKPDLIWQHTTGGWLSAWLMNGATLVDAVFLTPNQVPDTHWKIRGVIDLNGDDTTDLVWQHVSGGWLSAWLMNGTQVISSPFLSPNKVGTTWQIVAPK